MALLSPQSVNWQAVIRLGVPDRATVLEPGCGTGNFMAAAASGWRFTGVDMDSVSGRIARALLIHNVIQNGFETMQNRQNLWTISDFRLPKKNAPSPEA
jgi:ribosomal protein L11 methylase PrmA